MKVTTVIGVFLLLMVAVLSHKGVGLPSEWAMAPRPALLISIGLLGLVGIGDTR